MPILHVFIIVIDILLSIFFKLNSIVKLVDCRFPWSHGQQSKQLYASMACHQLLSGFLANGHLPRVSRQSCLPANDKSNNEVKPGAVHKYPNIYLKAEEKPGEYQLGREFCE